MQKLSGIDVVDGKVRKSDVDKAAAALADVQEATASQGDLVDIHFVLSDRGEDVPYSYAVNDQQNSAIYLFFDNGNVYKCAQLNDDQEIRDVAARHEIEPDDTDYEQSTLAAAGTSWDDLVDMTLDSEMADKLPGGLDELVDAIAVVLNGGVFNYVQSSSYARDHDGATNYLWSLSTPKAEELTKLWEAASENVDEYLAELETIDEAELDSHEEGEEDLQAVEDWLYKNENLNALCTEILASLTSGGPQSVESATGYKLKRDVSLKSGAKYPIGTSVTLRWFGPNDPKGTRSIEITPEGGSPYVASIAALPQTVSGFTTPSQRTIEKWSEDGIAKTPTGKKTEPDGYGSDGSPSWLLALGYI